MADFFQVVALGYYKKYIFLASNFLIEQHVLPFFA